MSRFLRIASVCSGIGGAELAFAGLGHCVFAAETEAFPRAVLRHHFKDLRLYGDFRDIPAGAGPVDVLVGGTPCQSFSVAGLRRGMADERGNLALEYLRLVDRIRPRWVLWENVPGVLSSAGGRDFGCFIGGLAELGYGFAWTVLDAQYFGLAQRRKRVFVVGCAGGDWQRAAAVLAIPEGLRGHPAPRREAGQGTAPTLAGSSNGGGANGPGRDADSADSLVAPTLPSRTTAGGGLGTDFDCDSNLIAATLRPPSHGAAWRDDGCDNLFAFDARQSDVLQYGDQSGPLDTDGHSVAVVHSLRADGFDASDGHVVATASLVRRLTPTDRERLQGFPDGWTDVPYRGKPAADGPRYRALGNAFAIPVVRWIARRIAREHG